MAEFLTFVVSGLAGGASYALLALGLVLVNRSSRILNFAQGEIGALATFVVASLVGAGRSPSASASPWGRRRAGPQEPC